MLAAIPAPLPYDRTANPTRDPGPNECPTANDSLVRRRHPLPMAGPRRRLPRLGFRRLRRPGLQYHPQSTARRLAEKRRHPGGHQELRRSLPGRVSGRRHRWRVAVRLAGGSLGTAADDGRDYSDVFRFLRRDVLRPVTLADRGRPVSRRDGRWRRMGRGCKPGGGSVSPKSARPCLGDLPCHQRAGKLGGGPGGLGGGRALALRLFDFDCAGHSGVLGHEQHPGTGELADGRRPRGRRRRPRHGKLPRLAGRPALAQARRAGYAAGGGGSGHLLGCDGRRPGPCPGIALAPWRASRLRRRAGQVCLRHRGSHRHGPGSAGLRAESAYGLAGGGLLS